jgi:DNA-binding XRE family transcriptional regulator
MDDNDIKDCITIICTNLPILREMLKLTQTDVSVIVGTSRQQILKFEHEDAKLTRSILIALITYFSLRPKTAQYLSTQGLYNNKFVQDIGFDEQVIFSIIENKINGGK